MPRVQSALENRTYQNVSPSIPNGFNPGPPLDYFDFGNPVQPSYSYPVPFSPDPALNTPLPADVAQVYDNTALYSGQPPMNLDTLSSEDHPEVTYEDTALMQAEGENAPLYGGLLPISPQSDDENSLVSHGKATKSVKPRNPKKKEDRHSTSPVELDASRRRGRPRLDTRDQTATERRRTQIRIAQRAYRQRKETTISGLNKRVAELERTIEEMNNSFLDFNDKAISSGIRRWEPSLAQDLKTTMRLFLKSARRITGVDEEEDEQVPNLSARVYGDDETPPLDRSRTSRRPRLPPRSKESSSAGEKARAAPWGYETIDQKQTAIGEGRPSGIASSPNRQVATTDEAGWSAEKYTQQYRVEIPETALAKRWTGSSVGRSLPLPKSCSTYETSFGRRLLRQTLESALRLMTSPESAREDIERICKFNLHFSNVKQMVERIQKSLLRSTRESLEDWEAPLLHLGGAGLHYPRIGIDGTDNSPPSWWAAEACTEPMYPIAAETPVPDGLTMTQVIKLIGFDGEWFDPNDVEQYLRSRGLYMDARSSWVEIPVPELSLSETQNQNIGPPSESSMDSQSPRIAESFFPHDPVFEGQDYFWNADTLDVPDFSDVNMDYSSGEMNFLGSKVPVFGTVSDPPFFLDPILADTLPTSNPSAKKFIDVEKFLNTLIDSAVCLGRTPGFRRSAIDSALINATHDVW